MADVIVDKAALEAGRKIFDRLVEYPLPAKQGTKDYVFYFVPDNDGYGKGARLFFNRFYTKHKKTDVKSLEELIAFLYNEVKTQGIKAIREVVIVTHGTAEALFFPLVKGTLPDTSDYKFLTPVSMLTLQKDFLAGKLTGFNQQRKAVIACLQNDSWITIRACNFGRNKAGLYGVYSFFGGRANVYCPKMYQFFGDTPIGKGMRYDTPLKVHEHLVKQRFFPKDVHTPDRRDAIVRTLIDPGKFSEPVPIASKKTNDTSSAPAIQYKGVVDSLNTRTINAFLKQQLQNAGFQLVDGAKVAVVKRGASWRIAGSLTHEKETFKVIFSIEEQLSADAGTMTLQVDALIPDAYSSRAFLPLQLFLDEEEHKQHKGWLFALAAYAEDPKAPPADKQKYQAVMNLLNAGKFTDGASGGVDITLAFKNASIPLTTTPAPTITQGPSVTKAGIETKTWTINNTTKYLIKTDHANTEAGVLAHALSVYSLPPDDKARLKAAYDLLASPLFGTDPDLPGAELLAFMDQYRLDELIDLIDFLRTPYKPENVIYIHHAQEAMQRKQGFPQWYANSNEKEEAENNVLINGGYTSLSLREHEDRKQLFYEFDTSLVWSEVKSSNPSATNFKQDLFTEEPLPFTDLPPVNNIQDPDSPFTDIEQLRTLEKQGKERFFSTDKIVIPVTQNTDVECEKFGEVLAKIKALNTKNTDEIIKSIGDFQVEEGKTLADYLTEDYGFSSFKLVFELMENFEIYAESHSAIAEFLGGIVETRIGFGLGLTFAIGEVILMEIEFMETQQKAVENWERLARISAVRQWARMLRLQADSQAKFPTTLRFSPEMRGSDKYYIARYFQEQIDTWGHYDAIVFAPDKMKEGFDEGWAETEAAGNEVLEKVDEIFDGSLQAAGLDPCKIQKLRGSGLVDPEQVTKLIMRKFSDMLIERTSKPSKASLPE